jgi:hypothetical protein
MYITQDELKAVLYEYQVAQITDNDTDIVDEAIKAAELLVRGYLDSSNKRRETASLTKQQYRAWKLYDIDTIFSKTGTERNSLLMRIIKRIAAYNIIELSCPDVLSERIQSIYDGTLELLSKIAGEGEYAKNRFVIPDADYIDETGSDETQGGSENPLTMPFRMVSRKKFRHEPL